MSNKGRGARTSGSNVPHKNKKKPEVKNLVSVDDSIKDEAILLCVLAFCILIYVALFGGLSSLGSVLSGVFFGLFGIVSYILPVAIFFALAFYMSNKGRSVAALKFIAAVILLIILMSLSGLMFDSDFEADSILEFYTHCSEGKCGGGIIGGTIAYLFSKVLGSVGTYILLFIIAIACIVLITEKSFFSGIKKSSETIYNSAKDSTVRHREVRENKKRMRYEIKDDAPEEVKRKKRRDNVVSGVTNNTEMTDAGISGNDDFKEISALGSSDDISGREPVKINIKTSHNIDFFDDYEEDISVKGHGKDAKMKSDELYVADAAGEAEIHPKHKFDFDYEFENDDYDYKFDDKSDDEIFAPHSINITGENIASGKAKDKERQTEYADSYVGTGGSIRKPVKRKAAFKFPPVSMLKAVKKNENVESVSALRKTAARLQEALATFGVNVQITDIAQGPSVTRYEMSLESGTKVSKILGLTDDIKLSMAAKDVRIEAPIPGKSAVGIEIPNKEVSTVSFRELIENKNYKEAESKISFAVGKDLSGDVVVADIGKMPHMLIAGATGSGKSVCINTLIMSIIYKARPEEVKLIMIDPKVVELSVYNGIPHLLIPVVTDPRKAASALNWGVAEMTGRYNKFAEFGVRDLKGYNKKVRAMEGSADAPEILPQIVIIVDELADLMMVASKEVEEAICRLAQLARAAGIHLVIATQRPSVDVITGLIKANMPSRIAFAVSSGVDSRTILDMNGAERLLGKGDMLFYPQGYSKPVRVQGAFISDEEISEIVDFLKSNAGTDNYDDEVVRKVEQAANTPDIAGGGSSSSAGSDGNDEFFVQAARLVIEQDKASIGFFQRKFKIGFNRAARIMDQLYEAGIVSAEEGTKPRRVLMSMEQFENKLEQGEF